MSFYDCFFPFVAVLEFQGSGLRQRLVIFRARMTDSYAVTSTLHDSRDNGRQVSQQYHGQTFELDAAVVLFREVLQAAKADGGQVAWISKDVYGPRQQVVDLVAGLE